MLIKSARRAMGIVTAGVLAALLLPATSAGASTTASTLYRQAMATTKDWSVHYTSSGEADSVTQTESGDAGPASGTQQVNIQSAAGSAEASLIVIGQATYVKGNVTALENLMGLAVTDATADAGHWILIATDNSEFAQVVDGIQSQSVTQELELKGPLTLGAPRRLDGYEVDAIRGTQDQQGSKPMHVILFVRSSGRPLIVEEDSVGSQGKPNGEDHIVFSKWGERIRPRAPQATISLGPVSAT